MLHVSENAIRNISGTRACIDFNVVSGATPSINTLTDRAPASHQFLRESWFCRGASRDVSTLVARRSDGREVFALPLRLVGPQVLGARALAGSYWPFRSVALAQDASVTDFMEMFENPVAQAAIGPVLRIGPIYAHDPLAILMAEAARLKGWSVLTRQMGQSFVQDVVGPDGSQCWPSASRRRKVRRLSARLEGLGPVTVRIVRGAAWSRQVFRDLAAIERNSWVGTKTDHSGAKFINPAMLAHWQRAVVDPVIADMLAASILYVGDRPVAFSLDLTTGALQYGIASSYDEAFAPYSPGQIITVHAVDDSVARGVRQIDWGAGDSGYKRELGAQPGAAIHDILIVRSTVMAAALRPQWEESAGSATSRLTAGIDDALRAQVGPGGISLRRAIAYGLALSAAASLLAQ
jgi:CelD/BcsL family acetyltransferase involved in cellulose biosynthesis